MHKIKLLALMIALAAPLLFFCPFAQKALADSYPPATPATEPAVIQTESLENGKIIVNVGTPRNAAYRIGASIPVVIVFELPRNQVDSKNIPMIDPTRALADSPTAPVAPLSRPLPVPQINIEGLSMGVLSAQPEDVEMLAPPVVQRYTRCGKDYMRVVFWVWQFVTTQKDGAGNPRRQVAVTADFLYAVDALPDGQPDWKKATTPAMLIDIVPTAGDEQTLLREGDLHLKDSPTAAIVPYIFWGGILLMLPLVYLLGRLAYAEYMRPRRLSPEEIFWQEIDPVIAHAEKAGRYSLDHYQKMLYELRRFYGVSTLHTADVLRALEAAPHYPTIARVFALEGNFFMKDGTVTPEQHEDLMSALELLVPRN